MESKTFAEFVRTATRPVLTFTGLLSWVMFIEWGIDYPPAFQWLVVAMCLEWFAERGLTRFTNLMKNGK